MLLVSKKGGEIRKEQSRAEQRREKEDISNYSTSSTVLHLWALVLCVACNYFTIFHTHRWIRGERWSYQGSPLSNQLFLTCLALGIFFSAK